jgi:N6-adenosine-specific RNA methylase IME4
VTWPGLRPPYGTVMVDPPWRFASAATKADARRQYSTMDMPSLETLPIQELVAPSAHLWCWAVNGLMEEAHRLVRAWGFQPTTIVTWCKTGPGVGHYLRNNTEHIILATRGKAVTPVRKPLSTWYVWPRGGHSEKPAAAYDLIESCSPGPYVELFQRRCRLGWDGWGLGVEGQLCAG